MNNRKIFFRADAGNQIGYGHFIRSLALADMLKEEFDCTFFTQTPTDYQKREASQVCPLVELPADDRKFDLFLDKLTGDEIVVLDNYFFTTDYQRAIKAKGCKLVCIDDMHNKHYVADVVINHGIANKDVFDVEPYTRLCLGLDWALLRRPFLEAAKHISERTYSKEIQKVAVCFGGSDTLHLTEQTIRQLLQNPAIIQIDAIVGNHFTGFDEFTDTCVRFHQNISAQEVANIFWNCDLAIVSASSVCIEALACGAKVAAGWYVENQREFYEYLENNNIIIPLLNFNNLINLHSNYNLNTKNISILIQLHYNQLFESL
ncbi:MAG: UDP-2,4-diacetamido-2,4,6-trideoxy-beta-L-altropyranose hydrolase [Bacteroidales bacterium]|nr:UDP-2,4-diacetamido-2,4,6-trideoxy-beta-L-altropyranose hydrolase [Bacteroidales bacterium]MDD3152881.1 UDP-2,4-diacetamido-2,4,6-trideoxy-beta-L-altropyranose hydrolase [Bacteroidales bacterium]MDD3914424.1 UDP-2,4-diacetamido-2,4,6-trideoxy-beta-L-altropyranose hydrolase [Bacteroidales bacterium]MDD4634605.1 UDP-2,4-diacetamido-2,4,6-trideoxy-beta-L-altropyranose hydrolase [Bacteroidales bacterium]